METGRPKQGGTGDPEQEQDTHKDTGSRWGQWEWGCGQGHQEQGGGTGSQTGTRTVEAGLQSASQEQDGDRDMAQAGCSSHKEMAAQGAVSCGDLPSPWDGDKQGQLGGSTQGHSLLMALLRVGAHPPGCVPELSPDPLMPRMEPPVPQCVIPRASVYLRHGPGRHSPWGILHPHRSFVWEIPAAWQGLGAGSSRTAPTPRAEPFPRKIPARVRGARFAAARPRRGSAFSSRREEPA